MAYLVGIFENTSLSAINTKRVTIMHMQLATHITGEDPIPFTAPGIEHQYQSVKKGKGKSSEMKMSDGRQLEALLTPPPDYPDKE